MRQTKQPHPILTLGHSVTQQLPRLFRVCSWNWHKCKHKNWPRDFFTISQQTDLFLAQEVSLSAPARRALRNSPLQWHTAVSFLSARNHLPIGVAIGSCAAPLEITAHAPTLEPLIPIAKMMLCADIAIADTRLRVLNVHAVNFTGIKPFELTLQHIHRLLADFPGPVLLAGDFNAWNKKRTQALQQTARQLQLQEVNFDPDLRSRYLHHPVDFLFTRGLDLVRSDVQPFHSSDHAALTATLQLCS